MEVLIWFLGIPAALIAVWLLTTTLEWVAWHAGEAVTRCQDRLTNWRTDAAEENLQQEDSHAFLTWLSQKAGLPSMNGKVDEDLVAAHKQADLIRILVEEEIPKAVTRCLETHRLTAKVAGAYHLSEIAYEVDCFKLRAGMVWLLAHTVQFLDRYPLRFDDSRLLHNSIVLRKKALPTCRRCPYIQLPAEQMNRLCPTAELVQIGGHKHNDKE
jgi:hypothetical protein